MGLLIPAGRKIGQCEGGGRQEAEGRRQKAGAYMAVEVERGIEMDFTIFA